MDSTLMSMLKRSCALVAGACYSAGKTADDVVMANERSFLQVDMLFEPTCSVES